MKNNLILFLLLNCSSAAFSQARYDYQWLYGFGFINGTTIDFNDNPFSIYFQERDMDVYLSNASICDKNGELLFYTNGCYIADATHQTMANGDSINPGRVHDNQCSIGYPLVQGSIILPITNRSNIFYYFHKPLSFSSSPNDILLIDKLYYSIIDMSLENGLGEVTEKNQPIINDTLSAGELTAVKHQNNEDWWVISAQYISNKYYTLILKDTGIDGPFEQQIGMQTSRQGEGGGQTLFSPDGEKYIRYNPTDGIFIFDFDRSTGILSNFNHISVNEEFLFGGAAISSNSRFLYVTATLKIYQFDLWTNNIAASRTMVAEYDGFTSPFPTTFYQAQLAPDCRIYINSANGVDVLHVINHPNKKGLACDVRQHAIQLPANHQASMPNFPNYRLGTGFPVCDSSILTSVAPVFSGFTQVPVRLFPNPVQEVLNIELAEPFVNAGEVRLVIYDLSGKEVWVEALHSARQQIEVSHLPAGAYFCSIFSKEKKLYAQRIVILR